jgi:hypothetical protein
MKPLVTSVLTYYESSSRRTFHHIAWIDDSEIADLRPGVGKLFRLYLTGGTERVVEGKTRISVQFLMEGERR